MLWRRGVVLSRDAFVLIDAPPRGCPTDAGAKIRCMNPRDSHVARAAARAFLKSWRIVSATLVVTLSRVAEESRSKSSRPRDVTENDKLVGTIQHEVGRVRRVLLCCTGGVRGDLARGQYVDDARYEFPRIVQASQAWPFHQRKRIITVLILP